MPRRKGVLSPQNSFLHTIATRFDRTQSCFLLGSAQVPGVHRIVYCSDGFCTLTGYPRAQVMQKSCSCDFLFGEETDRSDQEEIWRSLSAKKSFQTEISFYKKDGSVFECLLDIVPIPNQNKGVVMFLVSLKDITPQSESGEKLQIDCKRAFLPSDEIQSSKQHSEPSWRTMADTERASNPPAQRRRSRAVLYTLPGHLDGDSSPSRANGCKSISSIFSGNDRQVLEYNNHFPHKRSRYTILHYGAAKTIWDWFILLLTLYVAAIVPYYAALQALEPEYFREHLTGPDLIHYRTYVFDIIVEFLFIIDMAFSFRTTYVDKRGQLVSDSREIAINYLKSTFAIDFVAAVPFDFISHIFAASWSSMQAPIQLLKTVRLLRVFKLYKKIDNWSHYRLVVLFMLMLSFGMMAHWLACIWFAIGWTEFNQAPMGTTVGTGWIYELSLTMHQPFNANKTGGPGLHGTYLTSLYFTLSSLTSVGFGNVSANTNAEKIFSICVMLIGAIYYAIVFGSITAIIQRMYEKRSDFDRRERNLTDFMKVHRFPKDLKRRMIDTFQGKWAMNKGVNEVEVLSDFPLDLQADIAIHLHRDLLNLPIFRGRSEGCRRFVSLHASRRFVAATNTFVHTGDALTYVYLVCSGSLEVSKNEIVSAILSKGDLFGGDVSSEDVVISRANVKALTVCELQCVSLDGLKKMTEIYPQECDMMEDLLIDFSCQLWEDTTLDVEEQRKRRSNKIESWNKHYSFEDDEEEEDESDDSSCVYFPAITVSENGEGNAEVTDDNDSTGAEASAVQKKNETAGLGAANEAAKDGASGGMVLLEIPTIVEPNSSTCEGRMSRSPSCDIPPSPSCLRSRSRQHLDVSGCNLIKKRVSFNDGDSVAERLQSEDYARLQDVVTMVNELHNRQSQLPANESRRESVESLNWGMSPNRESSEHFTFPEIVVEPKTKEGDSAERDDQPPPAVTREVPEDAIVPSLPSPSCSDEVRKRRRRRKTSIKHDQKDWRASSSSLEEDVTKSELLQKRQRKHSAVEQTRKEDAALWPHLPRKQQPSAECSGLDGDGRLQMLDQKFDGVQHMISSLVCKVDEILSLVRELRPDKVADGVADSEREAKSETEGRRGVNANSTSPPVVLGCRSHSSHEIVEPIFEEMVPYSQECNSLDNIRRDCDFETQTGWDLTLNSRNSEKGGSETRNLWRRPVPKRTDGSDARISLHPEMPDFRLTVPPYPDKLPPLQGDVSQSLAAANSGTGGSPGDGESPDKVTSNHVIVKPLPISQANNRISPTMRSSANSPPKCTTIESRLALKPFRDNLSHSIGEVSSSALPSSALEERSKFTPGELKRNRGPHINLPMIAISDYDECEAKKRKATSMLTRSVRQGVSCLSVPARRRTRGSESGYSTASPSPDLHAL